MCHGFADYRFLSFRPSEIAAAVVLLALVENQVIGFSSAIAASEIPVNKVIILFELWKTKTDAPLQLHCF
jgi:cyclin D1/2/4